MYGDAQTACSRKSMLIFPLALVFREVLVDGCCVKAAVLFYLPMTTSAGVCWRWRSVDGKTDSTQAFSSYHDCLEDARAKGYCVEATAQRADTAPAMRSSRRVNFAATHSLRKTARRQTTQ